MCMKFNFISICTYLCGVFPMFCSWSNYFGPNEFAYLVVLDFILGSLEMHWKLVSFKEGVISTLLFGVKLGWSWTLISYINQCYPGNKYLSHAHISSFQPCVGCISAWIPFIAIHVVLLMSHQKHLYCKYEYAGMITYQREYS